MNSGNELSEQAVRLRKRAEEQAAMSPETFAAMPPEETRRMFHELLVHQIELEMQNEELRRIQVELDAARERYFELYELAPSGYCTINEQGLIQEANLKTAALLGAPRSSLLKQPVSRFILKEDQDIYYLLCKQLLKNGEHQACELRMVKKDWTSFWVDLAAATARDANGDLVCHVVLSDITERKQAEREIKLKNEELVKLNAEKDKFFSIIAHDLRSPFNSFLGLTHAMAEELPRLTMDEVQKIAVSMENSATSFFQLLENLLHWARAQQGLIPFNPAIILLRPVLDESLGMALESAQNKGIDIVCNIPYEMQIFADSSMLQTIIRNLVSNAIKFTRKEGKITISAKVAADQCVEISVEDTGIGMNKSIMDNIFRIDVRTNRKGTDGESSTGIGLLLCKEFVGKHGGRIWVESEESKGSTFHFTIPCKNFQPACIDNVTEELFQKNK